MVSWSEHQISQEIPIVKNSQLGIFKKKNSLFSCAVFQVKPKQLNLVSLNLLGIKTFGKRFRRAFQYFM